MILWKLGKYFTRRIIRMIVITRVRVNILLNLILGALNLAKRDDNFQLTKNDSDLVNK